MHSNKLTYVSSMRKMKVIHAEFCEVSTLLLQCSFPVVSHEMLIIL
jgi:hypothetical protein